MKANLIDLSDLVPYFCSVWLHLCQTKPPTRFLVQQDKTNSWTMSMSDLCIFLFTKSK